MRFTLFLVTICFTAGVGRTEELTREQRLIVACHRLDVEEVVAALRDGADVNGRFGKGDRNLFQDPWTLGSPIAAKKWTPLIAVADSSEFPNPPRKVESTSADLDWARIEKAKIPRDQIEQRKRNMLVIAQILLSHRAEIDAEDGYGSTALYRAVYGKKLEMAKLLLRFNAQVNTKTGVYIDGSGDITPLHRAFWSAELTKLLLEKGADPNAKDTSGKTPRDWVRFSEDPAVAKLYEAR